MDLSLIRAARPFLPDLATRFPLPVWARRPLCYGTYRPPMATVPLPLGHAAMAERAPSLAVALQLSTVTVGELSSGMFTWEQGSRADTAELQINHRSGTVQMIHSTQAGPEGETNITSEATIPLGDRLGPAAGGG